MERLDEACSITQRSIPWGPAKDSREAASAINTVIPWLSNIVANLGKWLDEMAVGQI
jgi:hypothetical protein